MPRSPQGVPLLCLRRCIHRPVQVPPTAAFPSLLLLLDLAEGHGAFAGCPEIAATPVVLPEIDLFLLPSDSQKTPPSSKTRSRTAADGHGGCRGGLSPLGR